MFEYLRGTLHSAENNQAVIDVHGVGYLLGISLNTFMALPAVGEPVQLYVHYHVTESSQALFGFLTLDERSVFDTLLSINKVGPKVALNILSGLSVERIVYAVEQQDYSGFKAISGVGLKTAQRLVLELKGKLNVSVDMSKMTHRPMEKSTPVELSAKDDAYSALVALGYADAQIRLALARVETMVDEDTPVHEWITLALKVI